MSGPAWTQPLDLVFTKAPGEQLSLEQELGAAVASSPRHLRMLPCSCFSLTFPAAVKTELALTLHAQRSPLGFPGRRFWGVQDTGQEAGAPPELEFGCRSL